MKVNFQPQILNNNRYYNQSAATFTAAPAAKVLAEAGKKSKLFEPFKKGFDNTVDFLVKNYYARMCNSKAAIKFAKNTEKMGDMTQHMAALGATLISAMYVVRTLQNDNLDPQKRKTLALNDTMTWAISTLGAYGLNNRLASWFDNMTGRFVANYLKNNPITDMYDKDGKVIGKLDSRNKELLGEWKFENINQVVKDSTETVLKKYEEMKASFGADTEGFNNWLKKVWMKESHFEELKENPIRNLEDFNAKLLKNKKLDIPIKGFPILKTLFIFTIVYRYIVPVLIMKPANWIGNYIHTKNAAKNNPAFTAANKEVVAQRQIKELERPTMANFLLNK